MSDELKNKIILIDNDKPPVEDDHKNEYSEGYREGSRKTKAFYASLACLIALFLYGDFRHIDTKDIIGNVTNLALSYIVGVAATDSVRYYKYGSNTLKNPETAIDLKKRYADK